MTYSTTQGIARRATLARRTAGVTIESLAQSLDVSHSTMKRRLAGTHAWDGDDIARAASALGVSVDFLILGDEEQVSA
jgi:transcriptional regulator with XRE-family HTH domain